MHQFFKITSSELMYVSHQLNVESSKSIFEKLKDSSVERFKFISNSPGSAIKILAESIKNHPSLKEIFLEDNNLNDEEFGWLASALTGPSSVQILDVNFNENITNDSVPRIIKLINESQLQRLNISYTGITDTGLELIVEALENNPRSPLLELRTSPNNLDLIKRLESFAKEITSGPTP